MAREAAGALVAASKEADPSLGIRLLADTQTAFAGEEVLPSKVLLDRLLGTEELPWADIRGKPLDQRGLAHRLRQYGMGSGNDPRRRQHPKGYVRTDSLDASGNAMSRPLIKPQQAQLTKQRNHLNQLVWRIMLRTLPMMCGQAHRRKPSKRPPCGACCGCCACPATRSDLRTMRQ